MKIFHIFWTIALLSIFVSVIFWAFSANRKTDFEQASRLPLESDETDEILPPAAGMERTGMEQNQ